MFGIIGLLLSPSIMALTLVSASIDKNPVVVNESFVLIVTANDDVNTNALDTSPLMENFIVGRTSVSSQTSMVNFKTSRTTKWTTVLIPRKAGSYTIPPLTIEDQETQAIDVIVLAASDPQASKQQDLFITSEISGKEVYVQQQLTLTVKLHFAAELKRGSLTEPTLADSNITQIGKDKESETIINGRRYRVIERSYAISPQKSGDYILKSPVFSGEIMVPSTRRGNFLSFAETKPVSVIGDEIPLVILPIPENYTGAWLPSELLAIHQEWQPSIDSFKVGEPITRVITLTAAGLSEEQLPEVNMPMPAGLKVYPDQAELHTGMNNNRLVSQKVRNFAVVANKAGTYQLPEIVIPWWNTKTNRLQQATIAAQTITVLPNPDQQVPETVELASEITQPKQKIETVYVQQGSWLQWLFLSLWLLTSFAWLLTYFWQKESKPKTIKVTRKHNDAYHSLINACKKNDAQQALSLIVPWFNQLYSKSDSSISSTISTVVEQCNEPEFSKAILHLQQCVFGKEQQDWQGKQLLTILNDLSKNQQQVNTMNTFSLNP